MNYDAICDFLTNKFKEYYEGDVHVRAECKISSLHMEPRIRLIDTKTGNAYGAEFHAEMIGEVFDNDTAKSAEIVDSIFELFKFEFESCDHDPEVQGIIDRKKFNTAIR